MTEKLTALFRADAVVYDNRKGPGMHNAGGGLSTKLRYLKMALPNIIFVPTAELMGDISIIDVLYFSGGKTSDDRDQRIEAYQKHKGYKILWTSDFELLRWKSEHRDQVLDATDVIAGNSLYMEKLLKGYLDSSKVAHLTDPICTDVKEGNAVREEMVYACSQVILEKGIDDIVTLYKKLAIGKNAERQLERLFIGSSQTWGVEIRNLDSLDLEIALESTCTKYHKSLANDDVLDIARRALIFISFSRFETFGYAMVEAMLLGCHIWARNHLAYQERGDAGVINIVDAPFEAYKQISKFIEEGNRSRNEAAVQYVHDNYGLQVFRSQFKQIIGGIYGI